MFYVLLLWRFDRWCSPFLWWENTSFPSRGNEHLNGRGAGDGESNGHILCVLLSNYLLNMMKKVFFRLNMLRTLNIWVTPFIADLNYLAIAGSGMVKFIRTVADGASHDTTTCGPQLWPLRNPIITSLSIFDVLFWVPKEIWGKFWYRYGDKRVAKNKVSLETCVKLSNSEFLILSALATEGSERFRLQRPRLLLHVELLEMPSIRWRVWS